MSDIQRRVPGMRLEMLRPSSRLFALGLYGVMSAHRA
jgi:hypothetical protein